MPDLPMYETVKTLRAGTPTDSSLDLLKCLLRMVISTEEAADLYLMKESNSILLFVFQDGEGRIPAAGKCFLYLPWVAGVAKGDTLRGEETQP